MKRILLISYNFIPEITGIGKYNGEMMEWFARNGYQCSVLTGYPYYPDWKVQESCRSKRFWFSSETPVMPHAAGTLTIYRCPLYVPKNPSGAKRMLLDASFLMSAFLRLPGLLIGRKYDFVIVVAPPFHLGVMGLACKYLTGAKFIYHIQDIQIEAASALRLIRSKMFISLMLFLEKRIIRLADMASSISVGMVRKVTRKRESAAVLFPNWINTSGIFPMEPKLVRKEFGFADTDIIVLYSGAIGEKQGLEAIVTSAWTNRENRRLKFVICGNGPYKAKLQAMAAHLSLLNLVFFPLQPTASFNHFLNAADIHLVIQKAVASDLVMPSKLAAILAVGGLAVIAAEKNTSLYALVRDHNMGYVIPPENQDALNDAIATLLTGKFDFMRRNARKYAVDFLSIDKVMPAFEGRLNDLLSTAQAGAQAQCMDELVSDMKP